MYGYLRQAKPAAWKERFEDLEDKDNDSEDYEDYKEEDRNNIDLDDFIEEEKEEILEEFEEEMLWKRASCKAAKKPNNLIGNLLDYLLTIFVLSKVAQYSTWSMDFCFCLWLKSFSRMVTRAAWLTSLFLPLMKIKSILILLTKVIFLLWQLQCLIFSVRMSLQ